MRSLVLLATLLVLPLAARAEDTNGTVVPVPPTANPAAQTAEKPTVRGTIAVQAGQGRVVTLPSPATNIFVANPKVAEVRPASADSLFVFGNAPGSTTLAALDVAGHPIAFYTVVVSPNPFAAGAASSLLRRTAPGENARWQETTGGIALEGEVRTPADADRAVAAAHGYLPPEHLVQNRLHVRAGVQVLLQVHIAEMARQVTRELGVNWQALGTIGRYSVAFATANPLAVTTGVGSLTNNYVSKGASISNVIQALAQDNLARMLAEPNLTAMSGETASFLVGGEFPIPVAQQFNNVTIEFKQYGVALAFVPTVLDSGRINLRVRTEVSQLTQQGAVQLSAGNSSIQVPALTVRRAETTKGRIDIVIPDLPRQLAGALNLGVPVVSGRGPFRDAMQQLAPLIAFVRLLDRSGSADDKHEVAGKSSRLYAWLARWR